MTFFNSLTEPKSNSTEVPDSVFTPAKLIPLAVVSSAAALF